jgi:hypothetical protein
MEEESNSSSSTSEEEEPRQSVIVTAAQRKNRSDGGSSSSSSEESVEQKKSRSRKSSCEVPISEKNVKEERRKSRNSNDEEHMTSPLKKKEVKEEESRKSTHSNYKDSDEEHVELVTVPVDDKEVKEERKMSRHSNSDNESDEEPAELLTLPKILSAPPARIRAFSKAREVPVDLLSTNPHNKEEESVDLEISRPSKNPTNSSNNNDYGFLLHWLACDLPSSKKGGLKISSTSPDTFLRISGKMKEGEVRILSETPVIVKNDSPITVYPEDSDVDDIRIDDIFYNQ